MDNEILASQLRKPDGDLGKIVAGNMNRSNSSMNLQAIELLELIPGDQVLEIGMGNGFFCKDVLAADPTINYSGCDFSDSMVDEATQLNETWIAAGRAGFMPGDATALPYQQGSFTKLFTVNTMYFWDDPLPALAEMKRVLKPGGKAVLSLRTKESMIQMPFVKYGFRLFDKKELETVLEQAPFKSVNIIQKAEPPFYMGDQLIQLESLYALCAT